jgi:hypothetical protein
MKTSEPPLGKREAEAVVAKALGLKLGSRIFAEDTIRIIAEG